MNTAAATVENYSLYAANGRRIRTATKVTINGQEVRFMERMSKREAIRQAERELAR